MKTTHFITPLKDIEKNVEELSSYSDLREFLVHKIKSLKRGSKQQIIYDQLINILDLSAVVANSDWDATGALYFHLSQEYNMTHVLELTCPECDSTEIMCGEPSENIQGEITVTCVCLDCGYAWEM